MISTRVMVDSIQCENGRCVAKLSARGHTLEFRYKLDRTGRLREIGRLPISVTVEGWELYNLVERFRNGETMEFPFEIQVDEDANPRNPRRHFLTELDWLAQFVDSGE